MKNKERPIRHKIDASKMTIVTCSVIVRDLKIVIYQHGHVYSYGIFDNDTGESLYQSKFGYIKSDIFRIAIKESELF